MATGPVRRSQAQRRAATVDALLEATLASLVEVGLAATTTRAVAERAGVSQGAQQHHFPTKAALVDAAVVRAMDSYAARLGDLPRGDGPLEERLLATLDALWQVHTEPLMSVVHQVIQVARTHPETARRLVATLARVHEGVVEVASTLLPELAGAPSFAASLRVVLDSLRGASELLGVPGVEQPDWPATRERLAALVASS